MERGLEVKIWGTRGSLAAPYADRMEFGGNTSCVSVQWDEETVIFDCGTGLHALGEELLHREKMTSDGLASCVEDDSSDAEKCGRKELHIFLSHVHLDHVCALPFFQLLFRKNWKIHIYGQPVEGETFRETIRRIIGPPFWPITMEQVAADIVWHDLLPGMCVELAGGAVVKTAKANHGPGALIFRIERGGASFVYGVDHEITEETKSSYCEFVRNCDILLFDGMYTEDEYLRCSGFGHSAWTWGPKIGAVCEIGTVLITHHDWKRTDAVLRDMEQAAREINDRCAFAREGMVLRLG